MGKQIKSPLYLSTQLLLLFFYVVCCDWEEFIVQTTIKALHYFLCGQHVVLSHFQIIASLLNIFFCLGWLSGAVHGAEEGDFILFGVKLHFFFFLIVSEAQQEADTWDIKYSMIMDLLFNRLHIHASYLKMLMRCQTHVLMSAEQK